MLKPNSIICLYEKPENKNHGVAASYFMCDLLTNIEKYNYREISCTKYGFKMHVPSMGNIYPKLTWIAKKGSKVPKNKKCLELQKEAAKISEVDINKEEVCVIC